jgi:hypothetical protein
VLMTVALSLAQYAESANASTFTTANPGIRFEQYRPDRTGLYACTGRSSPLWRSSNPGDFPYDPSSVFIGRRILEHFG